MNPADCLVLSLFPGADLFGMAFESLGFHVVKGPEKMMGGDIRNFKGMKGKYDCIIGGPPCQFFSQGVTGQKPSEENLIPEFERVVNECEPTVWIMENVSKAPTISGAVYSEVWNAWLFGSKQHRKRRFQSNVELDLTPYELEEKLRYPDPFPTVLATEYKYSGCKRDRRRAGRKVGRKLTLAEMNDLMGLPPSFNCPCLLKEYQYKVRGNGVPLEMGRAIANAVKDYLEKI